MLVTLARDDKDGVRPIAAFAASAAMCVPTAIDLAVVEPGPLMVAGRVAPDAVLGGWRVWVHNGTGGDDAWADAGAIEVGAADTSGRRRVPAATEFGAVSEDDKDNTAAIQAALQSVAQQGGGVVALPRGRFRLSGEVDEPSTSHSEAPGWNSPIWSGSTPTSRPRP